MSVAPDQLAEIHRRIRECFVSHPEISVNPTKGDPPDQYEITYNLTGFNKNDDGEIIESTNHTVELAIPFGFPHFPPSCKPKSDIFHPDFDPAAICLGDFWHQDRSLVDLIIHLGKMLNGELYSTSNAFNEEAANWYQENASKFPLAKIDWGMRESASPLANNDRQIDTLDDNDLTSDFNYLNLEREETEDEITLDSSFPEIEGFPEVDIGLVQQLDGQKRYFELLDKAEDGQHSSEQISGFVQHAKGEIEKAKELHRKAKKYENQGSADKALTTYEQIAATVADFPAVDRDIKRARQTQELLGDIILQQVQETDGSDLTETEKEKAPKTSKEKAAEKRKSRAEKKKSKVRQEKYSFFDDEAKKSKIPLYLTLLILTAAVGTGSYYWFSFNSKLEEAEKSYSSCLEAFDKNQFDGAKAACDEALQVLKGVKFVQQDKVHQLQDGAAKILSSDKLVQGLAGNVLMDGKYLPKADAQLLQSMKQLRENADALYAEGKWQEALESYKKLQAQVKSNTLFDQAALADIKSKRLITEFRVSYDSALVPMQKGQWQEAVTALVKAQNVLDTIPEADRTKYQKQLQTAIQQCRFQDFKEQGDLFFTQSNWSDAISAYDMAISSSEGKAPLPAETIRTVTNHIKRAKLYSTIDKGNRAFGQGGWGEAIEAYDGAVSFLADNPDVLSQTDAETNRLKLMRISLQASIIRDRQALKGQIENNDLKSARSRYQQILRRIKNSAFAAEEDFVTVKDEIKSAVGSLDKAIYLADKEEYLKTNYNSLFTSNYPAAVKEKLTSPVITYVKETDSKIIFRMQCTEKGRGRPLTLVMFYAYNKSSNSWNLHSEN